MTRTVQDEVRPRLTRVEDRGQQLKTLGPASAQLTPGTAVALLGSPGVSLHRLAADVIRGIADSTLIVWLDLTELSKAVASSPLAGDPAAPGGVWDQALDAALRAGFENALLAEGARTEELAASLETHGESEDPGVMRIQSFTTLSRRMRRWPIIAIEAMHRLPWPVSERLQWTLRKALDNGERAPLLRLVLTGSSDFLSGEAIAEGAGFSTSPLYARTARYEVLPFTVEQLYELTPLPGGLPDRLLEILLSLTGGSVGFIELAFGVIAEDPTLGHALLEAIPAEGPAPPAWLWDWVSRADGVAGPARQLVREGLGALLSSPKGRSWPIVEALQSLFQNELVEEAAADALLPLELAGLAALDRMNGHYRYRFANPLIPPILRSVLPEGRRLRDQLEVFARDFSWDHPSEPSGEPPSATENVRVTGNGSRVHLSAPIPPALSTPIALPTAPKRTPLDLPPQVVQVVNDSSPSAARALLELLHEIALATEQARKDHNTAILTFAQLDIRWVAYTGNSVGGDPAAAGPGGAAGAAVAPGGAAAAAVSNAAPVVQLEPPAPVPKLGRWEVRVLPMGDDSTRLLEAAAFFVPPERLKDWMTAQGSSQPFVRNSCDDAYSIGIMAGLLLAREPDSRLVVERIEQRLMTVEELGIGPLLRLIRRCLDPVPRRRPTLENIINGLEEVMADPFRTSRKLMRATTIVLTAAVIILGLVDFAVDTRVDNTNWAYTGVKLVGAAAWAAFYGLAWFLLGRTNREQINEQFLAFLRQRLNRIRWMAGPALIAMFFTGLFAYRLAWHWGTQLSLLSGQKLVEIEAHVGAESDCTKVYQFKEPTASALVRLRLDGRDYVFVVDQDDPSGKGTIRRQYYWPADQVLRQRNRQWGDTLYVYTLGPPPKERGCIPDLPPPG